MQIYILMRKDPDLFGDGSYTINVIRAFVDLQDANLMAFVMSEKDKAEYNKHLRPSYYIEETTIEID